MHIKMNIGAGNSSNTQINAEDFPPGDYNLTITGSDINGRFYREILNDLMLSG